jgi:hypothetical protein
VKLLGRLLPAAFVTALLFSRDARADDLSGAMHSYFEGEKQSGFLWGSVGIVAMSTGGYLLTRKTPITRGAAYPLLAVGAIQTILGGALLLGTDARVRKLDDKMAASPAAFRDEELTRMRGVNRTFVILEIVEAVLIVGGTTLALATRDTWRGVGIGLAIQGTTMLALDALAHRRGGQYERALEGIHISATSQTISLGGVF